RLAIAIGGGGTFEIIIKQIEPGDKLSGLSLGHEDFAPLRAFLSRQAQKYEAQSLARTYAAFNGPTAVGYITLTCGEVVSDDNGQQLINDVGYPYHVAVV